MALRASKPSFNVREKLTELGRRFGLKGSELATAETIQEARDLVSAGRKNLIINGDFRVNQKGGTHTTISGYHLDRWKFQKDGLGQYGHSVTQSSDSPDGFNNSLRLEVTTTETDLGASEDLCLTQHVEGQNCQALRAGTDSAKPFTLSFWVKSNKPGTYTSSCTVEQSGTNKIFATTYNINQASVWEYKVVKFPPCPGVIADSTAGELTFRWILNSGSNYTTGTSLHQWSNYASNLFAGGHQTQIMTDGDIWQITGVQVEVGKNDTDFEYRPIGEELALCQRYYERFSADCGSGGYATLMMASKNNNTLIVGQPIFRVPKRASGATFSYGGLLRMHNAATGSDITISSVQNSQLSTHGGYMVLVISNNTMSNGEGFRLEGRNDTSAFIAFSSEL